MRKVRVSLGPRSHDILIEAGLLKRAPELLKECGLGKHLFLIANPKVFRLFGEELLARLETSGFQVKEILIPDGEKYKTFETLENIYTYLIAEGADRESAILALGGGVTGDLAGFAAATFYRGIPYVQIPTTLLAQVDSSVGGKTGVNHRLGKNLIGAFHQPRLVCIDVDTLASLQASEFQSGLYEALKYGLIYDAEFFEFFEKRMGDVLDRVPEAIEHVVGRSCEIKAEVISRDEREANLRRILNFGHTFGHALEAATGFSAISHGEAVAYGIIAATSLSGKLGALDQPTVDRIIRCIRSVGSLPSINHVAVSAVLEAMARDKKRQHDEIHFVLLSAIGKTFVRDNLQEAVLRDVWRVVVGGGPGAWSTNPL